MRRPPSPLNSSIAILEHPVPRARRASGPGTSTAGLVLSLALACAGCTMSSPDPSEPDHGGATVIQPDSLALSSPGSASASQDIRYATDFAAAFPSTGGIEGALLDFGPPPACGEIRLPKGIVNVSSVIEVRGRWGCRFIGHGQNEGASDSGTVLRWTGANGGTVLDVAAVQTSLFTAFKIDGNYHAGRGAGIAIRYRPDDSGTSSFDTHFSELGITDIKAGEGIAIHVGRADATSQTDHSTFEKIIISHSRVGVRQEGTQTVVNSYRDLRFQDMTVYGMDFRGGDAYVERCDFGAFAGSGALADVRVAPGDGWSTFIGNYHEGRSGAAYLFPQGPRTLPVTLLGVRVMWFESGAQRIVDYQQTGPLNLHGNSFAASSPGNCPGATDCAVYINAPGGGNTVPVSSLGNIYAGTNLSLNGQAFLAGSNDSGSSTGAIGNGMFRLHNTSLALEGGAMLWRRPDGATVFRQYLDAAGFLYWTTDTNTIIGGIQAPALDNTGYTFRFGKLRGDAEVRSDTLVTAPVVEATSQLVLGNGAQITSGTGLPTAPAPNGSLYLRSGGTGPSLYVRENGAWLAK